MLNCSKYTDQEIVVFVSKGEINAYSCLVEKYEQKLLQYILRLSNIEKEDAENILQEVFIKAYQNINSYNPKYSFSSWIYRITHNHTIDYHKKHKNRSSISLEENFDEGYTKILEALRSEENIEIEIQDRELYQQVRTILQNIDIKYREVLILKFLEEKNYDEISDILHIPSGTVATFINRGKKQFKAEAENQKLKYYL